MTGKIDIEGKICQNAENKQSFDLTRKIDIVGKTRQNDENKQTFLTKKSHQLRQKWDFRNVNFVEMRFSKYEFLDELMILPQCVVLKSGFWLKIEFPSLNFKIET